MIVDSFRGFAADHVDSRQLDHDGKFSDAIRTGMAELGLMGLNIPEEYGGFGASAKVFNRVFGEIGSHGSGAVRVLRRAPIHRVQGHHSLRFGGAEAALAAGLREWRDGRRVLPHRAGLGVGRAGDDDARGARGGRSALRAERDEDLDLQRGLRGRVHRVRQGPDRPSMARRSSASRRSSSTRTRPASPSASPSRRWASRRATRARSRSRTCACRRRTGSARSARDSSSRSRSSTRAGSASPPRRRAALARSWRSRSPTRSSASNSAARSDRSR